jgi:hypothetical protein
VGHHQKADRKQAGILGRSQVWPREVRLGDVSGDANGSQAPGGGGADVVRGAKARNDECADPGPNGCARGGLDVVKIAFAPGSEVHRASAQPVAVSDLDQAYARTHKRTDNRPSVSKRVLMADSMRAIA